MVFAVAYIATLAALYVGVFTTPDRVFRGIPAIVVWYVLIASGLLLAIDKLGWLG